MKKLYLFLIFSTLMLAGCGQSGPLYMPQHQSLKQTSVSTPISTSRNMNDE